MTRKKVLKLEGVEGYKIVEQEKISQIRKPGGVYFLAQASEIGFSIAIPISAGALFGSWLDSKWGTQPKMFILALLVGILFAFLSLFYTVHVFSKKPKNT